MKVENGVSTKQSVDIATVYYIYYIYNYRYYYVPIS